MMLMLMMMMMMMMMIVVVWGRARRPERQLYIELCGGRHTADPEQEGNNQSFCK